MRIAVFTDLFLPHVDGVTTSLVHLISEYQALGHEVLVVTPKTKGSESISLSGIQVVFLPSVPSMVYPEFMLGFFSSKLFFTLKSFEPEIVHVIAPGSVGSIGLFYAKLMNIKSVATFHGYFMEPEYLRIVGIKKRGVKLAQKFLWRYTKTFYDRADGVIAPTSFVKKDLETHNFSRPITVIKNAVDLSKIKVDRGLSQEFVNKYNLSSKTVVLYVGRVSIEKNIETLIRCFPQVVNKVSTAHLLIVGNGPDKERLEEVVASLQLEKNVTFTGEIKNDDLVRKNVFGAAKVFVTASHSEVSSMSIIEAMHFGLPIIAARSRGLVEMVKSNGFLVSGTNESFFASAIVKILQNVKLRNSFSVQSLSLVSEYSIKISANKHLKLYADLIANRTNRHILKSVLKLRVIESFKDLIFLLGTIHVFVLLYLFFIEEKLEYLNVIYILDFEKIWVNLQSTWDSFLISSVLVFTAYTFFYLKRSK